MQNTDEIIDLMTRIFQENTMVEPVFYSTARNAMKIALEASGLLNQQRQIEKSQYIENYIREMKVLRKVYKDYYYNSGNFTEERAKEAMSIFERLVTDRQNELEGEVSER